MPKRESGPKHATNQKLSREGAEPSAAGSAATLTLGTLTDIVVVIVLLMPSASADASKAAGAHTRVSDGGVPAALTQGR